MVRAMYLGENVIKLVQCICIYVSYDMFAIKYCTYD